MTITRDGKTYELTANELIMAYEEQRRNMWRCCMDDAINRNGENLRFREDYTRQDFLDECVEEMEGYYGIEDWDERCDEIIFDTAKYSDVWTDEPEEDEEEDEE